LLCAVGVLAGPKAGKVRVGEVEFTNEDYKRLDTFEAHRLTKADQVFAKGEYRQAFSEYDSFILEFPQSKALAFALLRKARCLHLDNKRYEAIKAYQEVLDYFPNVIQYAAPASFYTGQAHWENSSDEKAVNTWAKMAADKEYSQHPLGAVAFVELADYLWKEGKPADAVRYYEQVAVTFRTRSPDAANKAIARVVEYYIRLQPDEPTLRAFYAKVKTFGGRPETVTGEVVANRDYWQQIQGAVGQYAQFAQDQQNLRDRYYEYWAKQMDGKFLDWDEFQITVAGYHLAADRDTKKWMERLDRQFAQHQKAGDNGRIVRWMRLYREHKGKIAEYYQKLDFAKMSAAQLIDLMKAAYDDFADAGMGRSVYNRLPFNSLTDGQKAELGKYFWKKAPDQAKDLFMMMADKEAGKMELLRCYAQDRNLKEGLPLAEDLTKSPVFSKEALQVKADLLFAGKLYDKAIPAYQMVDNPPANLWKIADCYVGLGKIEAAVGQLREVENFFRQYNAEAALRIAHVYGRAGMRDQQIAALRNVLKKYPKSGQSSSAHQELEKMGVRIGGGVDANEN
jgi:TolA-binding protein